MKTSIAICLALIVLAGIAPANAQDATRDILGEPSMSVMQVGRKSAPVPIVAEEAVIKPAPAPVIENDPVPAPVGMLPPQEKPAPAAEMAKQPHQGAALADILAKAYTDSPALRAEREVLRQQYENVALAEANKRPIVTADGGIAWVSANTDPGTRDSFVSRDIGLTATQFLYRGGRTLAEVEQQLRLSDAALAAYDDFTQSTFLNVVIAAMDIQRDRATIDLTEQNRAVIARQLQTAQHGFEVGELTRTDVAQANARLSSAEAQLIAARADFSSALARFLQYTGQDAGDLYPDADPEILPVPASLESAQNQAESEHPQIRAATQTEKAAQNAIDVAQGGLLPEIYALGTLDQAWKPSTLLEKQSSGTIGVRASVPLYEGGAVRSQIRAAKYKQMEKQDRIEDAKRAVKAQVATAWNDYQASLAQIAARAKQVEAATLARNGVYKEREVGTRTVLDTLNADAELLDAQVGEVQARRDAVVAGYALLAATGQLTAEKLGLFSADSEKQHMRAAQHKWLGTSIDPVD